MASRLILSTLILLWPVGVVMGQNNRQLSPQEEEVYKKRASDLVQFFQYMVNTVGDKKTPVKNKETIITESYLKIFSTSEVQVEDDLLQDRAVVTNKTIASYLRDVDFFFNNVSFKFEIINISTERHENGGVYFKVTLDRKLSALSPENELIESSQRRYIEINWDEAKDDLKIASIYTTKLSRDEELKAWWDGLSYEWMSIFRNIFKTDTEIDVPTLYKMVELESIDLAGNNFLTDLTPLEILTKLKKINVSKTNIQDLSPLRGLTKLEVVIADKTPIHSIEYLKYCNNLAELNIGNTTISSIQSLESFPKLKILNAEGLLIDNYTVFESLSNLERLSLSDNANFIDFKLLLNNTNLRQLDLSGTGIYSISGVETLKNLSILDISRTSVENIEPIGALSELTKLTINNCPINSLASIKKASKIKTVYANNTPLPQKEVQELMQQNKQMVIVTNAVENEKWWASLSNEWKNILIKYVEVDAQASIGVEALTKLFMIDSLDISGNTINTGDPIRKFTQLKVLNISNSKINELDFLPSLVYLKVLNISNLAIQDIAVVAQLPNLEILLASGSKISSTKPLIESGINFLNIDNTGLSKEEIIKFVVNKPQSEIIFDSQGLNQWWQSLPEPWKVDFAKNIGVKGTPNNIQLHRLVALPKIELQGQHITSLEQLNPFLMLKEITLTNTQINNLNSIPNPVFLEKLSVTKSPLADIIPISNFQGLIYLNISDTPVEKLDPIVALKNLTHLNISGTNISNLKHLENSTALQSLDCSNTSIKNLSPLINLKQLTSIVCYNTKVNEKRIDELKKSLPECIITFY